MNLFPIYLKLAGRRCLVVGAGRIAEEKIGGLLQADADIHAIAPQATAQVQSWAREGKIHWEQRAFQPADLDGAFLIVAATSSPELHEIIYTEAQRRGILCNVVDDPPHCDFYYASVVRRGQLQFAISTAGHSPALAQRLRLELETQFGPEYALWLEELGAARENLFAQQMDPEVRKRRLHDLASHEEFERFLQRQNGAKEKPEGSGK
jgi:precorrin-2 dehydrogenase / sirohydrochlorin ferrochelatase